MSWQFDKATRRGNEITVDLVDVVNAKVCDTVKLVLADETQTDGVSPEFEQRLKGLVDDTLDTLEAQPESVDVSDVFNPPAPVTP